MHVTHTRYLSRLVKGVARGEFASGKVQNIALWGSNLPDGRKGAARTRKMRNSTRNGRMFWNHGARRTSSDNVETLVLVYTYAGTYIHPRALRAGYTCICAYVRRHPNRYTRRIKCISVTCGRVQKYKSRGALNQGTTSTARVLFASPFYSSVRPLEEP